MFLLVVYEKLVRISGQIPRKDGKMVFSGKATDARINEAKVAAKICLINSLAHLKYGIKNFENVAGILKLHLYINSDKDFTRHNEILDEITDLLTSIFGKKGQVKGIVEIGSSLPDDAMMMVNMELEMEEPAENRSDLVLILTGGIQFNGVELTGGGAIDLGTNFL